MKDWIVNHSSLVDFIVSLILKVIIVFLGVEGTYLIHQINTFLSIGLKFN